jgi:hypothetical protein
LEAAFGYTPVSADAAGTSSADAYSIPIDPETGYGVTYFPVQNPGPYQHDRVSPGMLIGNTPTPLAVASSRQFDANVYGFRLGPYLEFAAHPRVKLALSAGLALAYIESDFSYNETVTIPGVGVSPQAGSSSQSDWRVGGFVSGTVSYGFAQHWTAVAGAQFVDLGEYTHTVNDKQAVLDLRSSIFVTLGLTYSF